MDAAGDADAVQAAAKDLQHRIKTMCGVSARIDMRDVGGVDRSMGKAQRIVDNRPKG